MKGLRSTCKYSTGLHPEGTWKGRMKARMLFKRKGIRHGVACQESQHRGSQPGLQHKTLFKNKQTNKPEQKRWKENNLTFSGT